MRPTGWHRIAIGISLAGLLLLVGTPASASFDPNAEELRRTAPVRAEIAESMRPIYDCVGEWRDGEDPSSRCIPITRLGTETDRTRPAHHAR
jgi:hypothetical protein